MAEGCKFFYRDNEVVMTTKEARGTKRTCQNPDCEARFYDLGRDPITCPHCQTIYKLTPEQIADSQSDDKVDPETAVAATPSTTDTDEAGDGAEIEEDDALVSLEDAEEDVDDTSDDDEEDNTFLETDDDDDGDVSDILGGTVGEDGEDET
jgi:uncharacterized protein (TIGR02300 family)